MAFEVKDKKNRTLLHINSKGKLALSRFPDLTDEEIDGLTEIYHELSGEEVESIKKFLTFEENIEEEKFCS